MCTNSEEKHYNTIYALDGSTDYPYLPVSILCELYYTTKFIDR